MIIKKLYPDKIKEVLTYNINNDNVIFVFPTDVVMNSWIDWIVTHPAESGTDAVAFENFTAWDNFKKEFVSAHKEDENVIPTILRKMFITDLIEKNASKPRNERLQVIINPDDVYAKEADSFSDWLSKNLQSLHFWKKRLDNNREEYGELDKEDKDYLYIYEQYSQFLKNNKLFEAAWVEDIEFTENTKSFHIFYPELLEDFLDYKDIFESVPNITIYTLPEDIPAPELYFYKDSRSELRQTMLYIIDLVNSGKADWSDIVLSIPNLDTYRPYINREFQLYGIPYVIKAGVSLTTNSAGRIFREIYDCHNNNFNFDSVRTLLLDECVPWRDEYTQLRQDLIREGNRMRCICSTDKDIWLRAFNYKLYNLNNYHKIGEDNSTEITYFENLKSFYQKVKKAVSLFFPTEKTADTFENIRTSWMNFKGSFLKDDSDFSEDANNILSRCIKELSEIIEIEKTYSDCNLYIPSPYSFFLQELDKKTYTKQTKDSGVTIFPYKLSAAGYFKYQFVIDCSQKNLDISYKRLTYLNNNKRAKLKLTDDDKMINASEVFIKLYSKADAIKGDISEDIVHFSAAENTFNGFAIPHSQLKVVTDNNGAPAVPNRDKDDYIIQERALIRTPLDISLPIKLTKGQKDSYNCWKKSSICKDSVEKINPKIENNIETVLIKHGKTGRPDKIKISARGDLEQFFPCPRKWLFKTVLKLHDDTLDTNLMQGYDMGNLNHKILESFMNIHKDRILPYYDKDSDCFMIKEKDAGHIEVNSLNYDKKINEIFYGVNNIVEQAIKAPSDFRDSPLVIDTLLSQKTKIADNIVSFLKYLLVPYGSNIDKNGNVRNISGIGNCTVIGVEERLSSECDDYDYYGVVDCYVLSPENDWIIIDYKNSTGAIPATKSIHVDENEILKDFQMPVYYHLVQEKNINEIGAGYFYAIKDKTKRVVTDKFETETKISTDKDDGDLNLYKTLVALNTYSNTFIEKIKEKDFSPKQSCNKKDKMNVKSYDACKNCSFNSICRTTYSVGGKVIPSAKAILGDKK